MTEPRPRHHNNMKPSKKLKPAKTKSQPPSATDGTPRCGLCGKKGKLVRTECCGQWICDDEEKYVLFSYARNSCHRNHRRYTLCAYHHGERHKGKWQDCPKCRASFSTEIYVGFGTNEYNFEKLPNPPAYEPTRCDGCGVVVNLNDGGYSQGPKGIHCWKCTNQEFPISRRD